MVRELSQFETYLVHEFVEDYVDGIMSRRDMVRRVLHITGGVPATATVLTQLGVKPASAQEGTPRPTADPHRSAQPGERAEDDPRITAADITFPGADGDEITAYQAMPSVRRRAVPGRAHLPRKPRPDAAHPRRGAPLGGPGLPRRRARSPQPRGRHGLDRRPRRDPGAADSDEAEPQRHVDDFKAAAAYYATQAGRRCRRAWA